MTRLLAILGVVLFLGCGGGSSHVGTQGDSCNWQRQPNPLPPCEGGLLCCGTLGGVGQCQAADAGSTGFCSNGTESTCTAANPCPGIQ